MIRLLFLSVLILSVQSAFSQRIVSLASSLTKNLIYLEADSLLVGRTSYCKVEHDVPVVASAVKVNVEKVFSLKPDLVLATPLTDAETISLLRKMGLEVKVYPSPKSYDEICSQFLELAKLIGKEDVGKKVLAISTARVERLRATKPNHQRVFIELGANPLFAVLANTFMDDYITFAGASNIAQGLKSGLISRELVLAKNPDAIFIVTMGVVAEEEKKHWQKYKQLSATKKGKIFIIDSDKACTPTPVTFVQTLETIVEALK